MKTDPDLAFLAGSSSMARLIRERDWSSSALGAAQDWPQSLRSTVNLLLRSAFPMFVAWGPELRLLHNDAYGEILGAKHPASLGEPFLDVWHEIRADLAPLVARVVGGEAFYMENLPLRLRRRGYEEDAWFTFSWSPVLDDEGAIAGIYCACVETTPMVLAERQQRAEQERLQTLFNQAPGFAAVLRGPDHVFEMANQAYRQITDGRELIGKPIAQALPELAGQGYLGWLDEAYRSGEPFVGHSVSVALQRSGTVPLDAFIDFVFQPLKNAAGQVDGIFIQGHEVTDQYQANQALLAFSNSIPAIAWVAGVDGRLQRLNSQWEIYTGRTEQESLGFQWLDALHPDDREAPGLAWETARVGGWPWETEYRLRGRDGAYRWFHTRSVPQLDAVGRVLLWFGTTTDIEESKQTAQALRDADRQKDEFLATLAHELRNPLAPIRTAVHLLETPNAGEHVRSRAVKVIGRQVGHMAHLLDDLIDIARITQNRLVLKKDMVSVEWVMESALEAVRPLAESKRHVLTVDDQTGGARLLADPVRLTQILSNLLNNACKYTDPGGAIAFQSGIQDGVLVFKVTDTGIGLTAESIGRIFNMFAQEQSALHRSEGGLGVGLALAKGLVELHGGALTAYSDGPGHGSSFVVNVPVSVHEATPAAPSGASGGLATAVAYTVLLADDNTDATNVLADVLRGHGHVVHTVNNGAEAIDLASRLKPDILVLDIGMPVLNGYEVARWTKSQNHAPWNPLLIAATGWGRDDDRKKARDAGFDVHLTKPFSPAQLVDVITQHKPAPV